MTDKGGDDRSADGAITVELSIDDADLAERVRRMIIEDLGFQIIRGGDLRADVRISDGAVDAEAGTPVLVLGVGSEGLDPIQAGAAAVLSDDANADALGAAIRAAMQGLMVLSESFRDQLIGHSDLDGLERAEDEHPAIELTARELQVLGLLASGASNKSIARSLEITPHTAKFHVASIIAKLGATGRTDAVAKAMRLGLIMI